MDPIKKEALLEKQAMSYKEMSTSEKEASLERNRSNMRHKYHAMAPSDKKELLAKQLTKYKSLNPFEKEGILQGNKSNMKRKYHAINSPQKGNKQEAYKKSKSTKSDVVFSMARRNRPSKF
jgi:hypothetical protein